ncbi:MAG: hypothetical protein FJX74_10565, partial [Armatimonadetes bacterium]|nr:hypothetical protein [Armatimonadota bacterium]
MPTVLSILLMTVVCVASAQTPSAVFAPESFRATITPESLKALGFDPSTLEVTIPLRDGLTVTQKSVVVGEKGFLSLGMAERSTTDLTYGFSSRGSFRFVRDAASVDTPYDRQSSSALTVNLDQGFGGGSWQGKMSFVHERTSNRGTSEGYSESGRDALNLTLGLGKSASLVAGASVAEALSKTETRTEQQDVVLTSGQTAVVEYHHSKARTGGTPVETSQLAFRTPTIEL